MSPSTGELGAVPCGARKDARDVDVAGPTTIPAHVIGPAVLPMLIPVEAAAPKLIVVATVFSRFHVVAVAATMSPPETVRSPATVVLPVFASTSNATVDVFGTKTVTVVAPVAAAEMR